MRVSSFLVLLGVLSLVACGGETTPPPAVDGGGLTDLGGGETDARIVCTSDVDCNDGLFCNGREMCAPASSMADVRGCTPGDAPCSDSETCDETANDCRVTCEDVDGDGHEAPGCGGDDCDDSDASRYPGNIEVCNATDEDCNDATLGFVDADGDGVASSSCCNGAACGGDCNDGNADIRPGALDGPPDLCNTIDDDCDGSIDEGCPCTTGTETPCYTGAASTRGVGRCTDGFQLCVGGMLQDTCNGQQLPDTEICDTLDNDCDGLTNEDVLRRYYRDGDADGFGLATESVEACSPPAGYVSGSNDCADDDGNRNPGAFDGCNSIDDDCDGTTDEGAPPRTFHPDTDGDGFGATGTMMTACEPPAGYILDGTDCDDTRAGRHPGAFDACNMLDDDCDGATDEGAPPRVFHTDADGDGFGAIAGLPAACDPPAGAVLDGSDCDDGNSARHPGAYERCDAPVPPATASVDDDCDGTANEGCACTDGAVSPCGTTLTAGVCRRGTQTCVSGALTTCAGNVEPSAETCNGRDDDCDGSTDELVSTTCYADADDDGRGAGLASQLCGPSIGACPAGWSTLSDDCNDANPMVSPVAMERCNGGDDDCDAIVDEGYFCAQGATRAGNGAYLMCPSIAGLLTCNATCTAETFTTGAPPEACDGADNNCNGVADDGFACVRGATGIGCTSRCGTPGTQTCSASCALGVCNGVEVCNGCDDDGDTTADDGFACIQDATRSCTKTCGGVAMTGTQYCLGDCSGWSTCTAAETCNGCDDDLDGAADEDFTCERSRDYRCTTACGTPGQLICNSTCNGYTTPACVAIVEACNYCDDDGDGTASDEALGAGATRILDSESCTNDWVLAGGPSAVTCQITSGPDKVRLVNTSAGGGINQASAAWARRPMVVGYEGFHVRVSTTLAGCSPADPDGGWAVVFAENSAVSLGASGGFNSGVPATMRGLAVQWRFFTATWAAGGTQTDRLGAYMRDGTGARVQLGDAAVSTTVSCGTSPFPSGFSETQEIDVRYRPARPELSRAATLTVQFVEGGVPTTVVDIADATVPAWPVGTLLRFGLTAATGTTTAEISPTVPVIEQVGVCDSPYDGQVRIDGGTASGRLEVFHSGRWGTVCEDVFSVVDAGVACRQLGYSSGTVRTDVAAGADPIWLDDLGCTGTELGLGLCAHPAWGTNNCTHVGDVGVTCVP